MPEADRSVIFSVGLLVDSIDSYTHTTEEIWMISGQPTSQDALVEFFYYLLSSSHYFLQEPDFRGKNKSAVDLSCLAYTSSGHVSASTRAIPRVHGLRWTPLVCCDGEGKEKRRSSLQACAAWDVGFIPLLFSHDFRHVFCPL